MDPNSKNSKSPPTQIVIFQQGESGAEKIKGIREFGHNIVITKTFSIDSFLPEFIDEPEEIISSDFSGDLILSFLKHPDLIDYLARLCNKKGIPVVASGTKSEFAITPFTCCGLGHHKNLGAYGEQFGLPEFKVQCKGDKITEVNVIRGASCGATWHAIPKIIGLTIEEALPTIAREVQYLCVADPSSFDPISGKSALHYAGKVHARALKNAMSVQKK